MSKLFNEPGLELETDVLVIGGGPSAAWAAISAAEEGVKVVIADKGYLGTSGPFAARMAGFGKVLPPSDILRNKAKFERYALGGYLSQHSWHDRILDVTFENAPKVYEWGGKERQERGIDGSEVMGIMRKRIAQLGVKILDHSAALELLVDDDGGVAGARGYQRQAKKPWSVKAGATILASGGCAWLSKSLGCNTNTGDGLLLAAEAGGELSGMEFSGHYHHTLSNSANTKGAGNYTFATFYDEAGNEVEGCFTKGHHHTTAMAKALLKGKLFVEYNKPGSEHPAVEKLLRLQGPDVWNIHDKLGINPIKGDRFELTLSLEGTVRGTGGVRTDEECAATVPGLFAAGDAASREKICGAFTGGGGPNMTWVIGSGNIAGRAAARHARGLSPHVNERNVHGVGRAGLNATVETEEKFNPDEIVKQVQDEVFPLDKFMFRTEEGILRSLAKLEQLWKAVQVNPDHSSPKQIYRSREAVALLAAARWSYFGALERKETRGMHKRLDYPKTDPNQRHYVNVGGLDKLWTRIEQIPEPILSEPELVKKEVHA